MAEILEIGKQWFLTLGETYGVNPVIFGSIYVGAIPLFTLSIAWIIRNYRIDKSVVLPTLSAGFFFLSAYLYLFIVGKNVPWWVYAAVALMVIYGSYSSFLKVRRRINESKQA